MIKVEMIYEDGRIVQCEIMPPILVGRDQQCAIRIHNWRVAKEHARIDLLGDMLQIEDLGSLGGTRVNHKRVAMYAPIMPTDIIQIGPCRIQVSYVAKPQKLVNHCSEESSSKKITLNRSLSVQPLVGSDNAHQALSLDVDTMRHHELNSQNVNSQNVNNQGLQPNLSAHHLNDRVHASTPPQILDSGVHRVEETRGELISADTSSPPPFVSESIRKTIHAALLRELDVQKRDLSKLSDALLRDQCKQIVLGMFVRDDQGLSLPQQARLVNDVVSDAVGLGVLQNLIDDPNVSEILVNRFDSIFIERLGKLERHDAKFLNDEALRTVIERIVVPIGRRIDDASPMVDARLLDGSRVNAVISPVAMGGACLTIRKFPKHRLNLDDLVQRQAVTLKIAKLMKCCVEQKLSILISGGTGSGKTTLLNILASQIPKSERIITIEDAAELQISHPHVLGLESRPGNTEGKGLITIRDLVKNSLRMRPDRIVVGECRGAEAIDMLAAMNTGHAGSLTTLHANTPRDALSRLETMVLMAGMALPLPAIRDQIARAIQLIVQQTRLTCGRRVVSAIEEVTGIESGQIQTQPIVRFKLETNQFEWASLPPSFLSAWRQAGIKVDADWFKDNKSVDKVW